MHCSRHDVRAPHWRRRPTTRATSLQTKRIFWHQHYLTGLRLGLHTSKVLQWVLIYLVDNQCKLRVSPKTTPPSSSTLL